MSSQLSIMHGGQSVNGNSGWDNGQECASTNLSGHKCIHQKYRNMEDQKYRNVEEQKYRNVEEQKYRNMEEQK